MKPTTHAYRTLWLSDVHLGTRACRAEAFKAFLKAHHAETIYLVGDIIDGWMLKDSWYWPTVHSDILRLLVKKAKKCRMVYVPGNHDGLLRPFVPLDIGAIELRFEAVHVTANGRRLLVIHGDRFDPALSRGKVLNTLGTWFYDALIEINGWLHRLNSHLRRPHFSLAQFLKDNSSDARALLAKFRTLSIDHARKHGYDGIVTGHIHHGEVTEEDGILYANSGDWVDDCTAIAETWTGELLLLRQPAATDLSVLASA
ncbi:MAG: UDP-2,3-diacylglucosamine diphosphatase [Candidatus Sericytochromatia bacterium]|nr:UDP-2,3-diacylglucosamine diphosphatase [Candidatus Tanganyikabacteria bacterium]